MLSEILYNFEKNLRGRTEAPHTFPPRAVLLASFPKSGNSWFRFVVSNICSLMDNNESVDFHSIENYSPVIRGNRELANIQQVEGCPTFLKTHFAYTKHFENIPSVVIVRDPFKVISSYYDYLQKARQKNVGDINDFIFHWRYGFNAWSNFIKSWEASNAIILRYEDLQESPFNQINTIYENLGFEIDEKIIIKAIELSSRENMKKMLILKGDPHNKNNFNFVKNASDNKGLYEFRDKVLSSTKISSEFSKLLSKYNYDY